MNKDLDDRLLPQGEYRNAVNAQISRSEGENVGALENVLGNVTVANYRTLTGVADLFSIGYVTDESSTRIFSFLTNNDQEAYQPHGTSKDEHYIYMYNALTGVSTMLVKGAFLNFSTLYPITGVNVLEDLLFWTDNRNQPRKINIELAATLNPVTKGGYYQYEDQISVAKYNPYQAIEVYRRSSDLTTSIATPNYETTMYDVTDLTYPEGGTGLLQTAYTDGDTTIYLTKTSITGDIHPSKAGGESTTIGYINSEGLLITSPAIVSTSASAVDYTCATCPSSPDQSKITVSGSIGTDLDAGVKLVFMYNPYFDGKFNGDEDFLKKKFVRFSYRYRFIDGEYSIMAPFTQDCFIPRQDGYFMYKNAQTSNTLALNYKSASPPLEIQDEMNTYRTTTVDFMENKVDKIVLRIPLPYNNMETYLHVSEIDILYKESTENNVYVLETISVEDVDGQDGSVQIDGNQTGTSFTIFPANTWGSIRIGDQVTSDSSSEINNAPTLTAFNGSDTITLSSAQTLTNANRLYFNEAGVFEYEYQSQKPYKALTSEEITRTYDRVPVKALSQEIISNRVVYGNFQNKHTPPSTIDYNVAVTEKEDFDLGLGTTTVANAEALGQTVIDVATPTGTYNNGAIVTSTTAGKIAGGTTLVSYDSTGGSTGGPAITISTATLGSFAGGEVINFAAPNSTRYSTSSIEYPNSSLKTNRNYQVGVVLSDRWGRSSTVILSESDSVVTFENKKYQGSTVFTDYWGEDLDALAWSGDSLKVLFNTPITPTGSIPSTGWPGIYNDTITSADYNPLGWYSYKIVVKQTEQEYYNVYLPGVMAAYPEDPLKELGKTSHVVLINDNINKVPRDLTEVGPEQRQFRSSVVLHGRVENNAYSVPGSLIAGSAFSAGDTNKQYYPEEFPPIVSVISTDNDLFDGANDINYIPSAEFYNVSSDPLIGRINTPSKQFGTVSVITQAECTVATPGSDTFVIDAATLTPCTSTSNCIKTGQTISGDGIVPGTKVVNVVTNTITTTTGGVTSVAVGKVITFSPTPPCANPPYCTGEIYLTLPELAVMETNPVDSNLDIFWETTSSGLISDLNLAIENSTQTTADLGSWDTTVFKEDLNPGGSGVEILGTDFWLVDQFGNNIAFVAQSPAQLQLLSVTRASTGVEVGPTSGDPLFTLDTLTGGSAGQYNVLLKSSIYCGSNPGDYTYNFLFELNTYDSIQGTMVQTFITKTAVLINEAPSVFPSARCANVTYVPTAATDGNIFTAGLPAINGAHDDLAGNNKYDLDWLATPVTVFPCADAACTSIDTSIDYGPNGLNYVWAENNWNGTQGLGRFYFANSSNDPNPNMLVDDLEDSGKWYFKITSTVEDGPGATAQCSKILTIQPVPCYTYKYTYVDNGASITGGYTTCGGADEGVISFIDNGPSGLGTEFTTVCAEESTYTTNNMPTEFVQLALNSTDPANLPPYGCST